jgi:hypothetical protein
VPELLRLLAGAGATASWTAVFIAAIIAVFTAYIGIAMHVTLRARDPEQQKLGHEVLRDLLTIFTRRPRR